MPKPPDSYLNQRRPPLLEAIKAESKATLEEAVASLTRKGYYTPKPRPWKIGGHDRGNGHIDYAILDRFDDLVTEITDIEDAKLIIAAVNAYK